MAIRALSRRFVFVFTALSATAGLLAAGGALASPTRLHEVSTFEQLDKGEPKGTLVSSEGEVLPGREARKLPYKTTMVWSSARGDDGTVYLGTGDKGLVMAVRGDKLVKVADLGTVLVTALVVGPGGKLLAGTLPDARVVEVDPKTGKTRDIAKLPSKHVWALLYDAKGKRLFAAGGAPGKVYTVSLTGGKTGGKPEVYYDPDEKHLMCLALDKDGALLVGSSHKAVLYRVTHKDKATAVADFDATEVRDVVVAGDGSIYLAVNAFEKKTGGLPRYDRGDGDEGEKLEGGKKGDKTKKPKVRAQELRPGAKEGKGALAVVRPDGTMEQLTVLKKGYFTDLALSHDGKLWAAEGTEGRVLVVDGQTREVATVLDLEQRQVLTLALGRAGDKGGAPGDDVLGTGDPGAVYRVPPGPAKQPVYLSEVIDAKVPSRWGRLRVLARGGGRLTVESRSGNTAKPDKTWHDWQPARAAGPEAFSVQSPRARYAQIRFSWQKPHTAVLRSFGLYYLPQNLGAEVTEVTVEAGGDDKKDKDKPRVPELKLTWKTQNPDDDALVYRVYVREETGTAWRRISGPDPLDKAELTWNTDAVPDGYYRVRVRASDERDNAPSATRVEERVSERVLVDNRRPEVQKLVVRFPEVSGVATDDHSPIRRIAYTLNGRSWRLVGPVDGIYDSPTEPFSFRLFRRDLPAGKYVLAVRAEDEAGNVGVTQVTFEVSK